MPSTETRFRISVPALLCWLRQPHLRFRLTFSHLWRSFIVSLMLLTYVAGMWAGIVSPAVAHAAVLRQQRTLLVPGSTKPARRGTYASSISPCPALTGTPEIEESVDGLGTLSLYTFVKRTLDDRLLMETNAANGNLVAQYSALQIQGTGLNLNITLTYNSQSSAAPSVLGANWNLSVGNGCLPLLQWGQRHLPQSQWLRASFRGRQQQLRHLRRTSWY